MGWVICPPSGHLSERSQECACVCVCAPYYGVEQY